MLQALTTTVSLLLEPLV